MIVERHQNDTLANNVIEEHARLSRAIAALLLLMASGMGCMLDRAGLNGGDGAGGGVGPTDARGDAPAGDVHGSLGGQTGQGGAAGNGGGGSGGNGGIGTGGDNGAGGAIGGAGGNDGGADAIAPQDATDAITPPDVPTDLGGGPDTGPVDRPVLDALADGPACGSLTLCESTAVTVTLPGGRFTGTTSGSSADRGTCGGDKAPEAVFKLVLTQKSDVFVTTHGTAFDTVIYMRSGCCGTEVACNDDADNRKTSVLTSRGLGAGTYFIFVDGANGGASGDFTVDIYATPTTINATDNCGSPARIANLAVTGTTCGMNDDFTPNMGCLVGAQTTSADGVYYFVLDANSTAVTFSTCTNTCIDTVLYTRDVCTTTSTQKSCNDNFCAPALGSMCTGPATPVQSRTAATLGPGVHYLIVDSHSGGPMASCGSFTITPTGVPQ
jgi:hypothetical protein